MLFFSRGICCSARVCAHFVVGCVGSYGGRLRRSRVDVCGFGVGWFLVSP